MFKQAYTRANDSIVPDKALLTKMQEKYEAESKTRFAFMKPAIACAAAVITLGLGLAIFTQWGKTNETAAPMMAKTAAMGVYDEAAPETVEAATEENTLMFANDANSNGICTDCTAAEDARGEENGLGQWRIAALCGAYVYAFDAEQSLLLVEDLEGTPLVQMPCPIDGLDAVESLCWEGEHRFRLTLTTGESYCFDTTDPLLPTLTEE